MNSFPGKGQTGLKCQEVHIFTIHIFCGQNIGRKMTLAEFVENLAELNDGENFPKEVLRHLYHSIKDEKLECEL